jgi:hypothetical protein
VFQPHGVSVAQYHRDDPREVLQAGEFGGAEGGSTWAADQ